MRDADVTGVQCKLLSIDISVMFSFSMEFNIDSVYESICKSSNNADLLQTGQIHLPAFSLRATK